MKTTLWGSLALAATIWALFPFKKEDHSRLLEIPTSQSGWHEIYNGYGSNSFHPTEGVLLEPLPSGSPNETHANLILAKKTELNPLKDFVLTAQVTTERQLRTPQPNPWEVLWIFFNCAPGKNGVLKTNYFMIKPNGIELGRAFDHVRQKILFTRSTPQLVLGKKYSITLIKVGNHIDILVDGAPILSTSSKALSLFDHPGAIGIYTEDARARLHDLSILPLN